MARTKDKHHELRQYLLEQGIEEAKQCSPEELELLDMMLHELGDSGNSSTYDRLIEEDYIRSIPDIQEFIESDQYLGAACRATDEAPGLFPKWREVLYEMFDGTNRYKQLILAGGIGLGKSMAKGTPVPVIGRGSVPVEDVKVGDVVRGITGLRAVTATHDEGILDTLKIKTTLNYNIECGLERHRLLVLDADALVERWQFVNEFSGGEVVLLYPGNTFGANKLSDLDAFLLGLQTAEGCRRATVKRPNSFYLSVSRQEADFLLATFDFMSPLKSKDKPRSCTLSVKRMSELHREMSLPRCTEKRVPEFIKGATRRTICQYLRGCFSGDGTAFSQSIGYSTASRQLALDIQELLLRLGMLTRFEERDSYNATTGKQGADSNQLWLHGEVSKAKFCAEIGFLYPDKQAAAIRALNDDSRHNEHKHTFFLPRSTVDKLISTQPPGTVGKKHPEYEKSPRRLLKRLRKQGCTTRLLREVLAAGGVLPPLLQKLAVGEVFFDAVKSVQRSQAYCYDLSVETISDPSFISAGFMSHNSFVGSIVVLYKLCCALCLRNPQSFYGMSKVTSINFSYFSITQAQVKGGTFSDTVNMLTESPFFTEHIRSNSRKHSNRSIPFSKNLRIEAGSRIYEALGRNTLVALIDEINFRLERDAALAAADLFNAIEKRYKSRFRHTKDGMIVLISSAKAENDFLSSHIRKSRHDPTVKICEFPWWEVVGPVRISYSGAKFWVDIGDNITPASILQPGQEKNLPASRLVHVPEEHREDFEGAGGLDRAIRDVAGVATGRVAKLFPNMMPLINCIRDGLVSPFKADILPLSLASLHQLSDCLREGGHGGQAGEQLVQFRHGRLQPLRHPTMPRFLHIDISSGAQDNCGIGMVHPFATTKVERTALHNQMRELLVQPLIEVDFAIGLKRETPSDPLDFGKIRAFILWLRSCGFDIRRVTCDLRAMSQEMRNILTKMGFRSEYLSCDKTKAPYESFRIAVLEGRVHMADLPCFVMEAANLEDTEDKVDHPANFTVEWKSAAKFGMVLGGPASKDVADGVAGAYYNCVTDIEGMTDLQLPDSQAEYLEKLVAAFPNPLKETFELPKESDIQIFE